MRTQTFRMCISARILERRKGFAEARACFVQHPFSTRQHALFEFGKSLYVAVDESLFRLQTLVVLHHREELVAGAFATEVSIYFPDESLDEARGFGFNLGEGGIDFSARDVAQSAVFGVQVSFGVEHGVFP